MVAGIPLNKSIGLAAWTRLYCIFFQFGTAAQQWRGFWRDGIDKNSFLLD
jgi:hypothetical protein